MQANVGEWASRLADQARAPFDAMAAAVVVFGSKAEGTPHRAWSYDLKGAGGPNDVPELGDSGPFRQALRDWRPVVGSCTRSDLAKCQLQGHLAVDRPTNSAGPIWLGVCPIGDDRTTRVGLLVIRLPMRPAQVPRCELLLRWVAISGAAGYQATCLLLSLVGGLEQAIGARDPYTRGHGQRVAELASLIGEAVFKGQGRGTDWLRIAALLHDVGKIGVREAVLNKEGPLTAIEQGEVHRHAEVGAKIMDGPGVPREIADVVHYHHEFYSGAPSGYPEGRSGDGIPLLARIVGVADTWDAMTSSRPYRRGKSGELALAEIRRQSGKQFDPDVVQALESVIDQNDPAVLALLGFRCGNRCPCGAVCPLDCGFHRLCDPYEPLPTAVANTDESRCVALVGLARMAPSGSSLQAFSAALWPHVVRAAHSLAKQLESQRSASVQVSCLPDPLERRTVLSDSASCALNRLGFTLVISGLLSNQVYGLLYEQVEVRAGAPLLPELALLRRERWACGIATCDGRWVPTDGPTKAPARRLREECLAQVRESTKAGGRVRMRTFGRS